jgi:hypothetical protein
VINTDPNTSILGSDWIADRATVLAAKSVYARAFGILFGGHPPKMFVDALRYTRAPKYAILAAILLVPLLVLVGQQTTPVVIDGPQGEAKVIQVQGKNYVEVDEVARIAGGSLHFAASQIILTLAGTGGSSTQAVQSAQPAGFSKQFVSAGIETMREILEWHAALETAIERGYPLSDESFGFFRRQVQASLKHAEAEARTDFDQKALPLLKEFKNMGVLTEEYLRITAKRDYVAPDSLGNDPLEQKLLTCWQSLASMASSNQFVDDGSCGE